jgi:O-antigen/teichoic acid export membrane protein
MKNRLLAINAVANIIQSLVSAALLFILYRYINKELGFSEIGVWSIVIATVSASRLADFGISSGITRFIAKELAIGNIKKAVQVLETGFATLLVSLPLILFIAWPILRLILEGIVVGEYRTLALATLPIALLSLYLALLASIFQGALEGCQKMLVRTFLTIGGQIIALLFAFLLVPKFGLEGLAWTQVIQSTFILVVGWGALRTEFRSFPIFPAWDRKIFKEIVNYGSKVQAGMLAMMFFDPVTKALIAKFGGLEMTGYFELANQIVTKIRSVIISANQAIIPSVVNLHETISDEVSHFYVKNMKILTFFSFPIFSLLLILSPLISEFLLGKVDQDFLSILYVITLSWFINIFSGPAYFINMATGSVGINAKVHIFIGFLNLILGIFLGLVYKESGVILAYSTSLTAGSLLLIYNFHKDFNLKFNFRIYPNGKIVLFSLLVIIYLFMYQDLKNLKEIILVALTSSFIFLLLIWKNPLRYSILKNFTK